FPTLLARRIDFCYGLGANCLVRLLGLGPERSMGTRYLVILCSLSSPPPWKRLAWRKISMAWCGRFCHHHVQLSSGKLDYCRFAFLRITMKSGNNRLRPENLAALVWTTKSETLK